MPDAVVAHADFAGLALALGLLQRKPHELALLWARVGAVDQEEVDVAVLACELLDALLDARIRRRDVAARAEDLGRQVNVLALQAGFAQCLPDLLLVGVVLRRVDVAVPGFQCCEAGFDAGFGWRLVDAEAELGDLVGRVGEGESRGQAELRHGGHVPCDGVRVTWTMNEWDGKTW